MTREIVVTWVCDECAAEGHPGMFSLHGPSGWYVVERGDYSTDRAHLCSAACLVGWSKKREDD
jgi:hypothetical protein